MLAPFENETLQDCRGWRLTPKALLRVPTNSYRHSNLSFEIRLFDILRSII